MFREPEKVDFETNCSKAALCFSIGTYSNSALAQTTSATIAGTITDSSGAAVSDAAVTLVDTSTGTKRSTLTNSEGLYTITGPELVIPFPNLAQFNSVQSTGHAKYNVLQAKFQERINLGLPSWESYVVPYT